MHHIRIITSSSLVRRFCDRTSLSVGSFVRSFVLDVRYVFSKIASPISMTFGTDVRYLHQMSLLTVERSRSKFKVKTAVLKIFQL